MENNEEAIYKVLFCMHFVNVFGDTIFNIIRYFFTCTLLSQVNEAQEPQKERNRIVLRFGSVNTRDEIKMKFL